MLVSNLDFVYFDTFGQLAWLKLVHDKISMTGINM